MGTFYPPQNSLGAPPEQVVTPTSNGEERASEISADAAHSTYVLNLDTELDEITPERVREIEAVLRELTREPRLTVEKGSLRLVVNDPSGALGD